MTKSLDDCKELCDQTDGCENILYGPDWLPIFNHTCLLNDKQLTGTEKTRMSYIFTNYYKSASTGNSAKIG